MVTDRRSEPVREPRASLEELREAVNARDELLAQVGHDLRNSLAPLVLLLPMLESMPSADDFLRKKLAMLSRGLESCRKTLDRVVEISSVRESKLVLKPEPLELDAVVRKLCATHDVPVDGVSITGVWDRARVEQIVTHLVENALRHGARPVAVTVREDGANAEIVVQDAGPGLSREARERLDGQIVGRGELGVGFWIVRALVRAMGGTVRSLDCERGSRISVLLPRA